jgi:hypothetical protein
MDESRTTTGDDDATPSEELQEMYPDLDLSSLPDWWREAILEFHEHGLPPYRPPRFADGTLEREVVDRLEDRHGVEIDFIGMDTLHNEDWTVRVDGEPIGEIPHSRAADRAPLYGVTSEAFVELVEGHLE